MSGRPGPDAPAGLWLATLQRLVGRAAHEVKNSLNGVAVTLEVVRSRSGRPGTAAEAVSRFAESASDQLERLTAQTEALLTLAREPRQPCDVALVARSLHALLGSLMAGGGSEALLELELAQGAGNATTGERPDTVRLVLGGLVLAAIEQGLPIVVRVEVGEQGAASVIVRGTAPQATPPALAPAVEALLAEEGIRCARRDGAMTLTFAAPAR
jgi:signal transduction histidine kinase